MSELNPEALKLLGSAKSAFRPSELERAQLLAKLDAQFGGAAASPPQAPVATVPRGFSSAVAPYVVGLAVVAGGLLWWSNSSDTTEAAPAASAAPLAMVPAEAPPLEEEAVPAAPEASATEPTLTPPNGSSALPSRTRRNRDSLAEEVAILARAEKDLHGGRPADALRALDEHDRRFGQGLLSEERLATRAQVLCRLGRHGEAELELAKLARLAPRSPHTERARATCRQARAK